jgi:hypothetical protein
MLLASLMIILPYNLSQSLAIAQSFRSEAPKTSTAAIVGICRGRAPQTNYEFHKQLSYFMLPYYRLKKICVTRMAWTTWNQISLVASEITQLRYRIFEIKINDSDFSPFVRRGQFSLQLAN